MGNKKLKRYVEDLQIARGHDELAIQDLRDRVSALESELSGLLAIERRLQDLEQAAADVALEEIGDGAPKKVGYKVSFPEFPNVDLDRFENLFDDLHRKYWSGK